MPWKPPVIGSRPVAILGAGVLGRRIACSWVTGGYNVAIRDLSAEQRQAAMHYIDNNLTKFSKIFGNTAKKPGEYAAFEDLDSAVKNAWFALEAVPEKLDLKISTFGELATKAPDDCILGSNSSSYKSSLMLDHVGKEARKRVLNVHYMMPPTNKIVEIMTSTYTHDEIFPFLARKHKDIGLALTQSPLLKITTSKNGIWMGQIPSNSCERITSIKDASAISQETGDFTLLITRPNLKTRKISTGNSTAPKLYVLDVGLGENITHDFQHAGRIILSSADGKNAKPIVTGLEAPDGIDISVPDNRIFWTNMGIPSENDGSIQSARLDGSDVQTVIAKGSVHTPKQICLDQANKKIYFCDREGMRVHRANFDGSEQEVSIQRGDFRNKSDMEDQTKWNGKFYRTQKGFSKSGKGRIFRANIAMPSGATPSTRSDIETVFENLPEPIDLEIDTETETLYRTDRGEYPLGNSPNRGYVGDKQKEKITSSFHAICMRQLVSSWTKSTSTSTLRIWEAPVYRTDADGKKRPRFTPVITVLQAFAWFTSGMPGGLILMSILCP
ncbi:3-hydroxyacyl-CoA dehydrogenase-like protein [Penicillium chermesinum]|nr:3-hydroxyacyl-CoA dehydrogenase-like protein [Penicillium chermesinum]